MKLNPHEAPKGYIAVLSVDGFFCRHCHLRQSSPECLAARCLENKRADGQPVYFIKKPKPRPKPKATYAQWAKKVGLIQPTGTVWNQWHMEDYTRKAYNAGRRSKRG